MFVVLIFWNMKWAMLLMDMDLHPSWGLRSWLWQSRYLIGIEKIFFTRSSEYTPAGSGCLSGKFDILNNVKGRKGHYLIGVIPC